MVRTRKLIILRFWLKLLHYKRIHSKSNICYAEKSSRRHMTLFEKAAFWHFVKMVILSTLWRDPWIYIILNLVEIMLLEQSTLTFIIAIIITLKVCQFWNQANNEKCLFFFVEFVFFYIKTCDDHIIFANRAFQILSK